jgi:hypothetical protein
MNKFRLHCIGAAIFSACAMCSVSAHAALSFADVSCDSHGTGMTSEPGYVDCAGSFRGNTLNQEAEVAAKISSVWGLSGLTAIDITGGNSASSGLLGFEEQSGPFVLSLKAGNAVSLYEFNGAAVTGGISSINFDTLGVGFSSGNSNRNVHYGQGLAQAQIYGIVAPAPEPETYALMLVGLGVLGAVARRRKS